MKALVLLCALAAVPDTSQCDRENAITVVQVPGTFDNPVMCGMQAMAYFAETSIAPKEGEYVRIVCIRSVKPNNGIG